MLRRRGKNTLPTASTSDQQPAPSSTNQDIAMGDGDEYDGDDDDGNGNNKDTFALISQSINAAMSKAVKTITSELLKAQTASASSGGSSSPGTSPAPSSGRSSTTPKRKRHERPSKPGSPAYDRKKAQAVFASMESDTESNVRVG